MAWVIVLLVAVAIMAGMIWLGKLPRRAWELAGAALFLGIAGYAWQGQPSLAGSPKEPVEKLSMFDEDLAKQRDEMGGNFGDARAWLVLADAQSRQGKFATAATALSKGLETYPEDTDLWVALGNALVGHSNGLLTPASQFAYQKAATLTPDHPAPPFFLGLALATSGQLQQARAIWGELLERSPPEAEWREDLTTRLARIDALIAQQSGAPALGMPGSVPPSADPAQPVDSQP
ncbi:cytochrome C biosynthesis protein [Blastomonas sp. AAP25]|uniref:tetratricopeptide repeat protein n=1 Tax=Blastomonas sp. AAP25 TaxID=1523416 RepID=UPI0006B9AE45|nr:tetratricopeptide repeat protein [Blastomonas sp. AAP25]KPF76867.1 cytochrome C biosynthesis protein [Blastomonas sp. AAP25]